MTPANNFPSSFFQVWKEMEGDFDERTTDDWDVDVSAYYDKSGVEPDKDARDAMEMRAAGFNRDNRDVESAFEPRKDRKAKGKTTVNASSSKEPRIGGFERHTRGFGRKIMERQGWSDGRGLGAGLRGPAHALDNEGQVDRTGLGYYGEKVSTYVDQRQRLGKRGSVREVLISTKFDDKDDTDPRERLKRTNPQNFLKHKK